MPKPIDATGLTEETKDGAREEVGHGVSSTLKKIPFIALNSANLNYTP